MFGLGVQESLGDRHQLLVIVEQGLHTLFRLLYADQLLQGKNGEREGERGDV